MTAYVVGFAFDPLGKVYLIRKNRPTWQVGLLNGIGGKVEPFESSIAAMSREFFEECGVDVPTDRWKLFHREWWPNGNAVDFYTTELKLDERPVTKTDERIVAIPWKVINHLEWSTYQVVYNLAYLIPMAYTLLKTDPANMPCHKN